MLSILVFILMGIPVPGETASGRSPRSSLIRDQLHLSHREWFWLRRVLNDVNRASRGDGFVFSGSRAHHLWRLGFDVDVSVIKARAYLDNEKARAERQFEDETGLRLHFLDVFQNKPLEHVIDHLPSAEDEAKFLALAFKIWRALADFNQDQSARASLDLALRDVEDLPLVKQRWLEINVAKLSRLEPWRPLTPQKFGNQIFYVIAERMGLFGAPCFTNSTFVLRSSVFIINNESEACARSLEAAGYQNVHRAKDVMVTGPETP